MRILVYGDSNSWGIAPDGGGIRMDENTRWPCVMAAILGAQLIEDALPGRTTVHDDPEMYGPMMNGLTNLPGVLLAQSPLDLVVIMLGTNDFKARFAPSAATIAGNIGRLIDCVRDTGGGPGAWDSGSVPDVAIIVPPPLPDRVDQPGFERQSEWAGGRAASIGLSQAVETIAKTRGVAVFDAGAVVAGSASDPIHLDPDSHIVLGRAVAGWLQKIHENAV